MDRRTVLRAGLGGGFAAGAALALGGCDSGSTTQAGRHHGEAAAAADVTVGSLILPGDRAVKQADRVRHTTGKVRSHAITITAGAVELGHRRARTWSYDGSVPGPVIRVWRGDIVRATFTNKTSQPTTVHWHGVKLRNDMDGTLATQHPIQPGAAFTYEFIASQAGTYWYHSQTGVQVDRGLYGMLIVEDQSERADYDHEWLVVVDDWIDGVRGHTPDKMLALLKQGLGGHAGWMPDMAGLPRDRNAVLTGAPSPLLGGGAGDVKYPAYLINGRTSAAPQVFTGRPGQRVRLRILNAGSDTAFRVALAEHVMTVTHADGHPVRPVTTSALLLGMAERYDAIVTLKDGVFPLTAYAEGKKATAMAVVRTAAGGMPVSSAMPAELRQVLTGYSRLRPASYDPHVTQGPDVVHRIELTGERESYSWGLNGQMNAVGDALIGPAYPRLVRVRQGQRVRITWVNTTTMYHSMHIHGHTFRVNGTGPIKDTVSVLPRHSVTCDFTADNPGQWMTHCGNVYHEQSGMMGIIGYVT
jgi:FtsP/CotA-like multicopper oxidase with cupredoxin domain